MTQASIARAFPDLPEALSRVAQLGRVWEMVREMEFVQREIQEADKEKVEDITSLTGTVEEIETAKKMATSTIVEILALVSEQDLEEGRDKELLSPEDYREALTAKRTMSLSRGRTEQERDNER